jgi:hypothetical protein
MFRLETCVVVEKILFEVFPIKIIAREKIEFSFLENCRQTSVFELEENPMLILYKQSNLKGKVFYNKL